MTAISSIGLAIGLVLPGILIFGIVWDVGLDRSRIFGIRKKLKGRQRRVITALTFVWIAALWCWMSYSGLVNPKILPPPSSVASALARLFSSGSIFSDLGVSLLRLLAGFSLAALLGTLLGLVAGSFPTMHAIVMPPNSFIRYVPATALIGLFFLWFGLGEATKIVLIFSGVFFFLLQRIADSAKAVPDELLQVAYTLGARRGQVFWRVILRHSLPVIVISLRIEMAAAWIFLIIGEMMASSNGLGNLISVAWRYANPDDMFAVLVVIGIAGLCIDMAFDGLYRVLFPYLRREG